jgi:hypothetical protein
MVQHTIYCSGLPAHRSSRGATACTRRSSSPRSRPETGRPCTGWRSPAAATTGTCLTLQHMAPAKPTRLATRGRAAAYQGCRGKCPAGQQQQGCITLQRGHTPQSPREGNGGEPPPCQQDQPSCCFHPLAHEPSMIAAATCTALLHLCNQLPTTQHTCCCSSFSSVSSSQLQAGRDAAQARVVHGDHQGFWSPSTTPLDAHLAVHS